MLHSGLRPVIFPPFALSPEQIGHFFFLSDAVFVVLFFVGIAVQMAEDCLFFPIPLLFFFQKRKESYFNLPQSPFLGVPPFRVCQFFFGKGHVL